jgi:hypothetical protein
MRTRPNPQFLSCFRNSGDSFCEAHAEIKGFLRVLGLSSAGARVVDELIRLAENMKFSSPTGGRMHFPTGFMGLTGFLEVCLQGAHG